MASSFVHLHNHTTYSALDGAQKLKPMISAAVLDGQPAISTTDHGNVYSLLDFYKECHKQGIKPILGTEAYMARNSVNDRPKMRKSKNEEGGKAEGGNKLYHHLTILAENNTGYSNLIKLSSRAFLEGFHYKPRVDWEILSDQSEGLIATTGCLGGVVLQELLHGRTTEALEAAGRLQEIFGKDNLFVELQDHGIPEQHRTNPQLIEIAKQLNAPIIATNDCHYIRRSDAHAHDVLLCCNTGSSMSDPNRFKFHGEEHYLKSANEMRRLFDEMPEACDNTLLIAERCNVEIEFGRNLLPKFDIPDGFENEEAYLRHLVAEGAQKRWEMTDAVANRVEYELETICDMNMAGYFLIVWDLIRHAHKAGIRTGPARGSAGGCAVAYALRITEIDPIRWDLLFERFLNPARVSLPDIDIDVPARYRDHMINYTKKKYGDDRVAQIITFGKIRSRQAVRDAARVMDKTYSVGDKIAKALPPLIFGKDTPLEACLVETEGYEDGYNKADKFRTMYETDLDVREVVDAARGIEGLHKSDGIHAAGVVIAPGPLTDYIPVQQKPKKGVPGPLTTQYEMHGIEELGLLKMDFLGLKTLDVLTDCLELIKARSGTVILLDKLEFNDEKTFELLAEGKTLGVFQLESSPMRDLLRRLLPSTFEDVAAVLALYRPGPMAANMHNAYADRKNGRELPEAFHADAKEILADTYGLCIYQEELMQISMKFADYSLGDGYALLKTCAKKLPEAMEAERDKFIEGMIGKGYDKDFADSTFDMVSAFSAYAFNKSHSYGYGIITYWTAYLKANHPLEFMTALLTSASDDKLGLYINEARSMGVDVLPPDINLSSRDFTPTSKGNIAFGLSAIKGIGEGPSDDISGERELNGPYKDFFDYVARVGRKALNKKVIESLAYAGAFSSLGHTRQGVVSIAADALKQQTKDNKAEDMGMMTLFDAPEYNSVQTVPDIEYPPMKLLDLEREHLGVWITGHPINNMKQEVDARSDMPISELLETPENEWRRMTRTAGIVVNLMERITKKGHLMKTFDLQDMTGSVPCVLFPSQTRLWGDIVNEGDILALEAKPQEDRGGIKLIVESVTQIRRGTSFNATIHLFVPDTYPTDKLKNDISNSHGDGAVILHWMGTASKLDAKSTADAVKELLIKTLPEEPW